MSETAQTFEFDLLGDPIQPERGRGRPQHAPTDEKRRIVVMLMAFDWSMERIAAALSITPPTLKRHYRMQLKVREDARARVEASALNALMKEVSAGNVSAIDKLLKRFDRHDLAQMAARAPRKPESKPGKKEMQMQAAREPDLTTPIGELIARRQGQRIN